MLQFQNADTSRHQGDSAAIFMLRTAFYERFAKKIYVDVLAHCGLLCHSLRDQVNARTHL